MLLKVDVNRRKKWAFYFTNFMETFREISLFKSHWQAVNN